MLIENKDLAEAYRKHFRVLWDQKSRIFRGDDEVKSVFDDIINTMKKGQEYLAFGVPPVSDEWVDYFDGFVQKMDKKGVNEKLVIDETAKGLIAMNKKYSSVSIKTMSKEHMTPAEVDIYGDKVAIVLWAKVPEAFVIENKEVAKSFKKYFEIMWGIAKDI